MSDRDSLVYTAQRYRCSCCCCCCVRRMSDSGWTIIDEDDDNHDSNGLSDSQSRWFESGFSIFDEDRPPSPLEPEETLEIHHNAPLSWSSSLPRFRASKTSNSIELDRVESLDHVQGRCMSRASMASMYLPRYEATNNSASTTATTPAPRAQVSLRLHADYIEFGMIKLVHR